MGGMHGQEHMGGMKKGRKRMKKESAIKRGKKKMERRRRASYDLFLDFGLGFSISPSIFYVVCTQ